MNEEKGVIRFAAAILVIAVIGVYAIATTEKATTEAIILPQETNNTVIVNDQDQQVEREPIILEERSLNNNESPTQDQIIYTEGIVAGRGIAKISSETIEQQRTQSLPGTIPYYQTIVSEQALGINALQKYKESGKEIYYLQLQQQYDWNTLVNRYNGNTKKIVTQSEIQSNVLRGDQVTFINLPQYAGQLVLMHVQVNNEDRFIQVNYDIYHQSKELMKSRFN